MSFCDCAPPKAVFFDLPKATVEMPHAFELLQGLAAQDVYIGIISNGAHATREATVRATRFAPLIKTLVSSESFGCKKPNADIVIDTARKAGFAPEECTYVGDHPINDAWGSYHAGMQPVLLKGFQPMAPLPPGCWVVEGLGDLIGGFGRG